MSSLSSPKRYGWHFKDLTLSALACKAIGLEVDFHPISHRKVLSALILGKTGPQAHFDILLRFFHSQTSFLSAFLHLHTLEICAFTHREKALSADKAKI